jgi:hypothetical protein
MSENIEVKSRNRKQKSQHEELFERKNRLSEEA